MSKENNLLNILSIFKRENEIDADNFFMVAGLGNPGKAYKNNRHNVGFMLLNLFAEKQQEAFSRIESNALVTKTNYGEKRLILVKPQGFMNRSGQSIGSLIKYYKIPLEQIMIVYDDVDLILGKIRIRPSGGSGGHKGISSIIDRLGTDKFPRMRLGIGRPPGKKNAAAFVLQDFSASEMEAVEFMLIRAIDALDEYLTNGIESAMNKYNVSEDSQ
jgi:PTH1 family peptidyl-tRNA hydrolase